MKGVFRLAASAYIVLICLIIINLFASPGGIIDYVELNEYKEKIEKNIYDLSDINGGLILDSDKLIHQSDEIKIQARELGWVEPNEGIIVVNGYARSKAGYSMGRLLSREQGIKERNYSNLIISMLAGLSFYIFAGFFRKQGI